MKLFGVALRLPTFGQVTSATVLAVGLWMLLLGLLRAAGVQLSAMDAGAALVVVACSALAAQAGVQVGRGGRHLLLNLGANGLLLLLYQAAWAMG